jgi:hypothetical protein
LANRTGKERKDQDARKETPELLQARKSDRLFFIFTQRFEDSADDMAPDDDGRVVGGVGLDFGHGRGRCLLTGHDL